MEVKTLVQDIGVGRLRVLGGGGGGGGGGGKV